MRTRASAFVGGAVFVCRICVLHMYICMDFAERGRWGDGWEVVMRVRVVSQKVGYVQWWYVVG